MFNVICAKRNQLVSEGDPTDERHLRVHMVGMWTASGSGSAI